MSRRFKKTVEQFSCEHCGALVEGNGFTNHCPMCLYSKHSDIFPGDRANPCGGLMEPISLALKRDAYIITHRCMKCGQEKRNRASETDHIEILLR